MPAGDNVILLHGLGRTRLSFGVAQLRLSREGYRVVNLGYPSRREPIEALADRVQERLEAGCDGQRTVHFVTHSLGGIIARYLIRRRRPERLGRVVMLSPPNQGNEIAELLRDNPLFKLAAGPAGQQLGLGRSSVPVQLPPPDFELGVIAGNRSLNPLFSAIIRGDNDGTVSVSRTRLHGMQDFLVVPHSHTFIMNSTAVLDQVVHFLEHGRFRRPADSERVQG